MSGSQSAPSVGARLPRSARLRRPAEFRKVFDQPFSSRDSCFTVLARSNDGQSARLGLAISKACARRAVDRNRIKRVVRESFRHNRHHLQGADFVVLCRRGALTPDRLRLSRSLSKHFLSVYNRLCTT